MVMLGNMRRGAGAGRLGGGRGSTVRVHTEKWEARDKETEWNAGDRAWRFIKRERILEAEIAF